MKEFFKILANIDILTIIPLPFVLGALFCVYNLLFNNVVKNGGVC